jgi:hypothetical protein
LTQTPTSLFLDGSQNYLATATAFSLGLPDFSDNFDKAAGVWNTGNYNDNYAKDVRKIAGGKYLWSVTTKQGVVMWSTLKGHPLPDKFYLAVDVKRQGSAFARSGLVFRQGLGTFYNFTINDSHQSFGVDLLLSTGWITIIPNANNISIRKDASNRLAVLADGSRYILFINGQYVGCFIDDRLKQGDSGLSLEISYEKESADFEFDNFELDH